MNTHINLLCMYDKNCNHSEITVKESPMIKYDSIPQQNLERIAQDFIATLSPQTIQKMNGRLERGLELAINGYVKPLTNSNFPRTFRVLSSSRNRYYYVNLAEKICTCPDSLKGNTCKHRVAAYYVEQALKGFGKQTIPTLKPNAAAISHKSNEQILQELGFSDNVPKGQINRTFNHSHRNKGAS